MDLESKTIEQLKELRAEIDKAIAGFDDRKRKAALAEIAEAARRHGFNLTDLVGRSGNRQKKADRAARYANPANRDETWSGLGRRPQWVKAALDAGQSLDDLAV